MNKYNNINSEIQQVINMWNKLDFSKVSKIENKGNFITFSIITYDNKSYDLTKDINNLLKNKHPYGNLSFSSHSDLLNEETTTNIKTYNINVFNDTNIDEQEYIEKLTIFYKNLKEILKKYERKLE